MSFIFAISALILQSLLILFSILMESKSTDLLFILYTLFNNDFVDTVIKIFCCCFQRCDKMSNSPLRAEGCYPFIGLPTKRGILNKGLRLKFDYNCVNFFRINEVQESLNDSKSVKKIMTETSGSKKIFPNKMNLNNFYDFNMDNDPVFLQLKHSELNELMELFAERRSVRRSMYNPSGGKNLKQDACFNIMNRSMDMNSFHGVFRVNDSIEVLLKFERHDNGYAIETGLINSDKVIDKFSTYGSSDFLNSVLNVILMCMVFECYPLYSFEGDMPMYYLYHSEGIFKSSQKLLENNYIVSMVENDKDVLCLFGLKGSIPHHSLLISYLGIMLSFYADNSEQQKFSVIISLLLGLVVFYVSLNRQVILTVLKGLLARYILLSSNRISNLIESYLKKNNSFFTPCNWCDKKFVLLNDDDYFAYFPCDNYDCDLADILSSEVLQSSSFSFSEEELNFDFCFKEIDISIRVQLEIKGLHRFVFTNNKTSKSVCKFLRPEELQKIYTFKECLTLFQSDNNFKGFWKNSNFSIMKKYSHVYSAEEVIEKFIRQQDFYFIKMKNRRSTGSILALTEVCFSPVEKEIFEGMKYEGELSLKIILHNLIFFKGVDNMQKIFNILPGKVAYREDLNIGNKCFKKYSSDVSRIFKSMGRKPVYKLTMLPESNALMRVNSLELSEENFKLSSMSKKTYEGFKYRTVSMYSDNEEINKIFFEFNCNESICISPRIVLDQIEDTVVERMGNLSEEIVRKYEKEESLMSQKGIKETLSCIEESKIKLMHLKEKRDCFLKTVCNSMINYSMIAFSPSSTSKLNSGLNEKELKRMRRIEEKMVEVEKIEADLSLDENVRFHKKKRMMKHSEYIEFDDLKARFESSIKDPDSEVKIEQQDYSQKTLVETQENIINMLRIIKERSGRIDCYKFAYSILESKQEYMDHLQKEFEKVNLFSKLNKGGPYIPLIKFEEESELVFSEGLKTIGEKLSGNLKKDLFNCLIVSGCNVRVKVKVVQKKRKRDMKKKDIKGGGKVKKAKSVFSKPEVFYSKNLQGRIYNILNDCFEAVLKCSFLKKKNLNSVRRNWISNKGLKETQLGLLHFFKRYLQKISEKDPKILENIEKIRKVKKEMKDDWEKNYNEILGINEKGDGEVNLWSINKNKDLKEWVFKVVMG